MNYLLCAIILAIVLGLGYYLYNQNTMEGAKDCRARMMTYLSPGGSVQMVNCWTCDDKVPKGMVACNKVIDESGTAPGYAKTGILY